MSIMKPAMGGYGQFCPIAKAAEIFAQRWTPLIIRELLLGSHRFNDLARGLPHIPHSVLAQRLRSLETQGVVERRPDERGRIEYWPTPAGDELFDVIWKLGEWGQRWANTEIGPDDLDPKLLMWDMRRRIHLDRLPQTRVVAQFEFTGAKRETIWLVLERYDVSVCFHDPGLDVDLLITTDTLALHRVWMGRLSMSDALKEGLVEIDGPRELARAFPNWLALSAFSDVQPAMTTRRES
jgi:DNA-binding HxlR family transcriptional regulator